MNHFFLHMVFQIYRLVLWPFLFVLTGSRCRYPEESCSRFTERMIRENGYLRGVPLGIKRILTCNPFFKVRQ